MNFRMSIIVAVCAALALAGAESASCGSGQKGRAPNSNKAEQVTATPARPHAEVKEMKVLAEGFYGKVEEPFLVVAREAQVYGELRALVEGLPDVGADFFRQNAVVAAFSGTRSSGGYGVEIKAGAGGRILIEERTPPKGAMTTMALTQPFKVVAVAVGEEEGVDVEPRGPWKAPRFKPFRVASGEFRTGGGFAGRYESLTLAGGLAVARLGKLVTLTFDLKGAGGKKERALRGAATGVERAADQFEIPHLDAGTLVDHPRSPLRVVGRFADDEGKLSLTFDSLPSLVNDGFGGTGKLEATATAP